MVGGLSEQSTVLLTSWSAFSFLIFSSFCCFDFCCSAVLSAIDFVCLIIFFDASLILGERWWDISSIIFSRRILASLSAAAFCLCCAFSYGESGAETVGLGGGARSVDAAGTDLLLCFRSEG